MNLFMIKAAVALAAGPGMFAAAATDTPLGSKIVYVEEHVGPRFDSALRSSTMFVDRFTGSAFRYGRCPAGARCIRVVESNATHGHGAWTTSTEGLKVSTIRLSSTLAGKDWNTRRSIIDHELGHANGIADHNAQCTSVMWANYTCRDGRLPARTFTGPERIKLARW